MAVFNFFPFLTLLILYNHSVLTTAKPNDLGNSTKTPPPPPPPSAAFKPGIAAIVGILTTMFSITFLLLLYVKHCKRSTTTYANTTSSSSRGYPPTRRNSGIDRKVIESLPMFRFSSLRGQKDGLECAVCLNKFEADEVLRLLPKCKHAFHVECVDTWLEAHSTCPLCRYRVDPEDVLLLDYHSAHVTPRTSDNANANAAAPRISGRHSSAGERGSALEIIAENENEKSNSNPNQHRRDDFRGRVSLDSWDSRRKTGNHETVNSSSRLLDSWKSISSRKISYAHSVNEVGKDAENPGRRSKASRKDGQLPVQGDKHRLEHRIIISGEEEGLRRWSDVQLYLGSEMLLGGGEEEGRSGSGVINGRSVSEITGMSRYRSNNGGKEERERQEEGAVKRWLAWVSQSQHHQNPAVQSSTSASPSPIVL